MSRVRLAPTSAGRVGTDPRPPRLTDDQRPPGPRVGAVAEDPRQRGRGTGLRLVGRVTPRARDRYGWIQGPAAQNSFTRLMSGVGASCGIGEQDPLPARESTSQPVGAGAQGD